MSSSSAIPRRIREASAFRHESLALLALGAVLSALAFLFPPTGDDWTWGTQEGMDRLHSHFAGYNGRYFGNFAVLLLTRTPWLTPFVIALTVCVILFLIVTVTKTRTWAGYLGGAALLVAMPLDQWRQTIVWISGFTNYTLATACLLVLALCIQQTWTEPGGAAWTNTRLAAAAALPFAFASTLFIEHVTLLIVLASLAQVVVLARARRLNLLATSWAVGAVAGAIAMFSNSAYREAADGTANYQGIGGSSEATGSTGLLAIFKQGTRGVCQYAITGNTVLNIALLVLILGLALAAHSRVGTLSRLQVAAVVSAAIAVAGSAAVDSSVDAQHFFGALTDWSWVPALALLIAVVLTARTLVTDAVRVRTTYLLMAGTMAMIVPLAAITPYGPRNFLPTYVLMTGIALTLLAELVAVAEVPAISFAVIGVSASLVVVVLASYFAVYSELNRYSDERVEYLRAAAEKGRHSPKVYALPYSGYLHSPDPESEGLRRSYNRFYGLPERMNIRIIPRR